MNPLIMRTSAVERTVAEFLDRPFEWGRTDCVQIAQFHLAAMGHRSPIRGLTRWRSEKGALRAFRAAGLAELADGLDRAGLERAPLATRLPGDLLGFPGEEPWRVALGVFIGNGQALACAHGRVLVGSASPAQICWRVEPCPR